MRTEPVEEPEAGDSAIFQDIGTYVGELYSAFEAGPTKVRAGKFDTVFGLASEALPGINSSNLASDSDADERLGADESRQIGELTHSSR